MKSLTKYIIITFGLMVFTSGNAAAQIRVFAQVDSSNDIYVGENFAYHIIIDGENKPGQIDTTPLAKYNPRSAGNRDVSQTSISIINGKTTKKVIKRFVMSYLLTTDCPGRIQLPPVKVTLASRTYQTNPLEVNILKPSTTDQLSLEVKLSEQRCYIGQPVIMTVKFYRYADVRDFQFNIPALHSDTFGVEDLDDSSRRAKEYRVVHKGRDAIVLTFSKVLIPKYPGEIEIGASSVSADVAVGQTQSRDPFFDDFGFFGSRKTYKRFMVSSPPLKLTVLPLPEQGKPPSFYGLIGRFTISASATPTKVYMGDPITLTIKIGGSKFLKPVQWPALEQVPKLTANFKIPSQKSPPTTQDGFKVFTQTIRPTNDKVTEIPPIPLPFFDPDKGKFLVAKSNLIKLEVAPTKILTNAHLEGRDSEPANKEVEVIKKGLSANYENYDEVLCNMSFSPLSAVISPGYIVIWSLPLALLIISAFFKLFARTSPEKQATKRRRSASSRAIRQLKKVSSATQTHKHELLVSVMKQYIGERFDRVAGSLTADDCQEVIVTATQDIETADNYRDIIAECEAAHYTLGQPDINPTRIKKVKQLIHNIEKKKSKK